MKCNMKYIVVFIFFFCILEEVHAKSRVEYRKMPCTMLQGITEREYTIYLPDDYYLSDTIGNMRTFSFTNLCLILKLITG